MNPFNTHYDPNYFCDRENDLLKLKSNVENGIDTLIHSPRRLGKTALIKHFFTLSEQEKSFDTLYIDLFATSNIEDLIRELAKKILAKYHSRNFIKGVSSLLKGLTATVNINPDGTPQLGLKVKPESYNQSLDQLFSFLEKQKKMVIIAFDEFQEVGFYPEKAEAILRTHIQNLNHVRFIFSGSSNHLLQEMFQSPKRPFFQSTQTLALGKIPHNKYKDFITSTFLKFKIKITEDAVDEILDFTDEYTYYTQVLCNQLFAKRVRNINIDTVNKVVEEILDSRKIDYHSLLNLLARNQRNMVIALAKEEIVQHPTAMEFISKHKLPSISSSLLALKTLNEKEIVYKEKEGYRVYDLFFKRFLQKWY